MSDPIIAWVEEFKRDLDYSEAKGENLAEFRTRGGWELVRDRLASLEELVSTLGPEDLGMEPVNSGEHLAWPWYRYPAETQEQFRGHGPARYKDVYPLS